MEDVKWNYDTNSKNTPSGCKSIYVQ